MGDAVGRGALPSGMGEFVVRESGYTLRTTMKFLSKNVLYKQLLPLVGLGVVFVAASVFAEQHRDVISTLVTQGGLFGIVAYILLTALFVVFVIPLDIAILIPIGAVAWGPVPTAVMSIVGWTIGAAIAFGTARTFGLPVVERMIGLSRVRALEKRLPKANLFWMVVFLRMLVSVDILSYALGLFSSMSWSAYLAATAIGVSPFGFYFAYTGALPFWYRVVAMALAVVVATVVIVRYGVSREP